MLTNTSGDKQAEAGMVNGEQSSRDYESLKKVDILSGRHCQETTGADEQGSLELWM